MTSAYRDNAAEPLDEPGRGQGEYINGGKLLRAGQEHICNVPGRWARFWNNIHFHDKWICTCGLEWEWESWNDKAFGHRDTNSSCIQDAWSCAKLKVRRR